MATTTLASLQSLRRELVNSKYYLNIRSGYMAPVTLHCSYGDSGEDVTFYVFDGGEEFVLDGASATIHGTRRDGANFGPFDCTVSGNAVTFTLRSSMTAVEGGGIAEISISRSGSNIGTCNFAIMVENAVFPNGIAYGTDPSVYQDILKYVQSIPASLTSDYVLRISNLNNTLSNQLSTEINNRISQDEIHTNDINTQKARIDEYLSSGTSATNSELVDIRVGRDGKTYTDAGTAVRTQLNDLDDEIDQYVGALSLNLGVLTEGGYINSNTGAVVNYTSTTSAKYYYSDYIPVPDAFSKKILVKNSFMDNAGVAFYDASKNYVSGYANSNGSSGLGKITTVTFNTSVKYLRTTNLYFNTSSVQYSETPFIGIDSISDRLKRCVETSYYFGSYSFIPSEYKNLNTVDNNSIVTYAFSWNSLTQEQLDSLQNFPCDGFQGTVLTISGHENGEVFAVQFASYIKSNTTTLYYRTKYSQWKSWTVLTSDSGGSGITSEYDLLGAFNVIGVIGDSLASGECYTEDGSIHPDIYENSWIQYLAKDLGITAYNFSKGGLTTRTWLTNSMGYPLASDGSHDCQAYFIGLGQNDANQSLPIGSMSDIKTNYSQNADTYYGNYGGIIQRMKEIQPDAKFFLFTDPLGANSSAREAYNDAVREICEYFSNCYLIDLSNDYSNVYLNASGFIQQNNTSNHYSAAAYKYMAKIISGAVDKIMFENPSEFKYIQFIGR